VVVAAAGRGERLTAVRGQEGAGARAGGAPKQFLPLAGVPLLLRAVRPFLTHARVAQVVAVLPPSAATSPPEWLKELIGDRLRITAGGATRTESVAAGVRVLSPECSIVLVHDGARPFPDPEVISAVIDVASGGNGAAAAIPVADTLKHTGGPETGVLPQVSRTVPRDGLWRAQTPQGFPRAMLETALSAAFAHGWSATDDSELVERTGGKVVLVRDAVTNLKITTPDDFRIAEALARSLAP